MNLALFVSLVLIGKLGNGQHDIKLGFDFAQ